jgi:hypothetical protein
MASCLAPSGGHLAVAACAVAGGTSTAWRVASTEDARCLGAAYGRLFGRRPHGVTQSTAGTSRRPYTGGSQVGHVAGAAKTAPHSGARVPARRQFSFRSAFFQIAKLQKLSTNLKISKNKSCRGAIDLQLSQKGNICFYQRFVLER